MAWLPSLTTALAAIAYWRQPINKSQTLVRASGVGYIGSMDMPATDVLDRLKAVVGPKGYIADRSETVPSSACVTSLRGVSAKREIEPTSGSSRAQCCVLTQGGGFA